MRRCRQARRKDLLDGEREGRRPSESIHSGLEQHRPLLGVRHHKEIVKGALDAHLRSLYKVGDFYKNGYYVAKDPVEAFHIYQHCTNMLSDEAIPLVGADIYMRMGDCFYEGFGIEKDLLIAQRFMSAAENMFYRRLADGDFYQKRNLRHVLDVLEKIRKEINDSLPDLSWSNYNG